MLAMLDQSGGTVRPLVLKAGANLNRLRTDLTSLVEQLPTVQGQAGDVHISNDLPAPAECDRQARAAAAGPVHRQRAVPCWPPSKSAGKLAKILKDAGLTKAAVEKAIADVRRWRERQ